MAPLDLPPGRVREFWANPTESLSDIVTSNGLRPKSQQPTDQVLCNIAGYLANQERDWPHAGSSRASPNAEAIGGRRDLCAGEPVYQDAHKHESEHQGILDDESRLNPGE
jgi:hypothetical protein